MHPEIKADLYHDPALTAWAVQEADRVPQLFRFLCVPSCQKLSRTISHLKLVTDSMNQLNGCPGKPWYREEAHQED